MASSSARCPVTGVIDGKFENGYLVTVTIGSEKLKGVLYQAHQNHVLPAYHNSALANNNNVTASMGVRRRRRRKKSEIKRRDPAHPKRGMLQLQNIQIGIRKTLEKLRPPSVTELLLSNNGDQILEGCLTNFFVVCCKVYQDKAMKHKERYRAEMEDYREKQKMDQVISDVVPLQLILPEPDTEMLDTDMKLDEAEEDSPQTPEESSSGGSDFRDEFDTNVLPVIGVGAESSCLDSEEKSSKGSL